MTSSRYSNHTIGTTDDKELVFNCVLDTKTELFLVDGKLVPTKPTMNTIEEQAQNRLDRKPIPRFYVSTLPSDDEILACITTKREILMQALTEPGAAGVKPIDKADTCDDKTNTQICEQVRREIYNHIRATEADCNVSEEQVDSVLAAAATMGYVILS